MARIQDLDLPYLEFAEASAPSTPASGIVRIYAKTDGSLYQKDDAGTETGLAGGGGAGAFHGCRVSRTTNQTISTGTFTDIQFNATDELDTDAFHDPSSNPDRVTIPTSLDGVYDIGGWISLANNTGGTFRLGRITVNGNSISEVQIPFHSNVGTNGQVFAGAVALVATDIVRLNIYQDTGGNLNVTAARLSISRIGT